MKLLNAVIVTIILLVFAAGFTTSAISATTGEVTTRFTIEKMNCPLCPITVRKSMEKVSGVRQVEVDYEMKIATVVFNPALTSNKQIADASTDIGYPDSILVDNTE